MWDETPTYAFCLMMYEVGEGFEASSVLNGMVEGGYAPFVHCRGRAELMEWLREASADADMVKVEDKLRGWMRLKSMISGTNEKCFAVVQRIAHETEYGAKMNALCRDVALVEKLQQEAEAGLIEKQVYLDALQRFMRGQQISVS